MSSDDYLKTKGNYYFAQKMYEKAISYYTQAIHANDKFPTYFTNRALCYIKMQQWDASCEDCRKAIDLDKNSVKGHFFLGSALLELERYDEAINYLKKARDLSIETKQSFGDDIASQIRHARSRRYAAMESKSIAREIRLLSYLNTLLKEECDRNIKKIKEQSEEPISEKTQSEIQELETKRDNYINELAAMYTKVYDKRLKREVPECLCGKISFELLRDPVVTPSGITYERKVILEHLEKVGKFDPVTGVTLSADQLIPNYAMKEVVESYLENNEWAVDF